MRITSSAGRPGRESRGGGSTSRLFGGLERASSGVEVSSLEIGFLLSIS